MKKKCRHPESHRGYRRHKPGYCSYTIAADGGSGYRSRFSTLRRLYATMYNNPPCASIGTRTRILTLEGLNTTLVLWTHDTCGACVHVSAFGSSRPLQKAPKRFRTTSAGFEPTRAEPTRFRVWRLNHSAMMPGAQPGPHRPLLTAVTRAKQKSDTFSICACHPCAGAMLIFSVSFQF